MFFFISALPYRSEISPYNLVKQMIVFMFTSLGDGRQVPKVLHRVVSVAILLLLASMLFLESSCLIGTSNTLSRWASFGLDLGLHVVTVARGWSPGAQSGALHCFGGELLLPASMLFVEYLIPIGSSNSLSRWASFGLDLGPALAWPRIALKCL